MAKPWNKSKKRRERQAYMDKITDKTEHPPCWKPGCTSAGANSHTCVTCEKLNADEVFTLPYCSNPEHRAEGLSKIKRHALTRHPSNLLRVIGAGLAGEEI